MGISFSKCMEMKKMQACMKQDMKEYAAKEGYAGFEELIDNGLAGLVKHNKKEKMGINALMMTMSGDMVFWAIKLNMKYVLFYLKYSYNNLKVHKWMYSNIVMYYDFIQPKRHYTK